jgi:hypothetical protein
MKKLVIILIAGLVALSACGKSKAKLLDNVEKDDNIIIAENSWMDKAKEYLSEYKPIALAGIVILAVVGYGIWRYVGKSGCFIYSTIIVVGCGIWGYLGNGSKNSSTVNSSTVNSSAVNSSAY